MKESIFIILSSLFSILFLWWLVIYLKNLRGSFPIVKVKISKRTILLAFGLVLITSASALIWNHIKSYPTIKGEYVRVPDDGLMKNIYPVLGPVKRISIIEWNFTNKFGKIERKSWLSGETYYFNEDGKKTKQISHSNSSQSKTLDISKGIILQKTYTDKSKIIERLRIDDRGELTERTVVEFDEKGNYRRFSNYSGLDGSLLGTGVFSVDKDYMQKYSFIYLHDSLVVDYETKYWRPGIEKRQELSQVKNNLVLHEAVYKYDSNGLLIHHLEYDSLGQLTIDNQLDRDKDGRLTSFLDKKTKQRYSLEYTSYDEYGNWLEVIWYENGIPMWLYICEIEYYEESLITQDNYN